MKLQAVRSKGQKERLYVNIPVPLAAALGMHKGEKVQWELLDRSELHLIRSEPPQPHTARRARSPKS